ncbi:MAG: homoserine dehydrogenase [Emergencia sp.]|nr:homoserine dehydrogenase [Emergencia sp.]
MKTVKIGILGLGTVGGGTYQILDMNRALIEKRTGRKIEVVKVLEKNMERVKSLGLSEDQATQNPDDILKNPEIDIVVESLGGIEPSTTFMLTAMEHGKGVVTPNKAAVAANYAKLLETAKANNVEFRFEASVGGGIPALTAILEALSGNEFTEVMGILNGTTNYILTKMTDLGLDYNDVLKDAQAKGFAEADPTADVEGIDVANKLSILMALAFDYYVPPTEIPTEGISKITMADIEAAKAKNCKIKLIAQAKKDGDKIDYSVKPMEIENSHPLAGVSNEFNAIYVTGNAVDEVMFYGKGAGALPTGSAIVGDILAIAKTL